MHSSSEKVVWHPTLRLRPYVIRFYYQWAIGMAGDSESEVETCTAPISGTQLHSPLLNGAHGPG